MSGRLRADLRHCLQQVDCGNPIDAALVGRQMLVLLAVIVVNMCARDEFAQGLETFRGAIFFGAVSKVCMTDVEIDAHRKTRLLNERAQIRRRTHLAGRVFDADRYTHMLRVQSQMLQRTKSSITLARIGRLPAPAHVKNHPRKGKLFRHIDRALEFVHRLDTPHALHFADRKRLPALARCAEIATRRRMQRYKLELRIRQRAANVLNLRPRRVVEVAARAKNLHALKSSIADL